MRNASPRFAYMVCLVVKEPFKSFRIEDGLIFFGFGAEDESEQEGEQDGGGDARAGGGEGAGQSAEQTALCAEHGAAGQEIAEPANGHGGAGTCEVDEVAVQAEPFEGDSCEHKEHEDSARSEFCKVDDHLCNCAYGTADQKGFGEHCQDN